MKVYMVNGLLFEAKTRGQARRLAADRIVETPRLATPQEIHAAGMRCEKIHTADDGQVDAFKPLTEPA